MQKFSVSLSVLENEYAAEKSMNDGASVFMMAKIAQLDTVAIFHQIL